jgi:SAM-dependent methyltransferase
MLGGADVSVANVAAAYDRHTGRYGSELSAAFVRFAGVEPGMRVLDVGCGPGALTVRLAELVGGESVAAVDPSRTMPTRAVPASLDVDVRVGSAEALPFGDGAFDAVLAQLVVQALDDAPSAVREMRRVASEGGVVAACIPQCLDARAAGRRRRVPSTTCGTRSRHGCSPPESRRSRSPSGWAHSLRAGGRELTNTTTLVYAHATGEHREAALAELTALMHRTSPRTVNRARASVCGIGDNRTRCHPRQ